METDVDIEKLSEFLKLLEKNKITYIVTGGYGLDGKRGFLTRKRQDADILCLKDDSEKINQVIETLGYRKNITNNMYKLKRDDGSKIDLTLIVIEGDEAVTYGRIAETRFPKELIDKRQTGHIGDFKYSIGCNEMLKIWGLEAKKGNDSDYVKTLEVDENIMKKVKRIKNPGYE
jgi:hypothetical protein